MNVFLADEQAVSVDVVSLRQLAASVLAAEQCPDDTELSVLLVGDEEMTRYNQQFMGRTGPTDVLSFPIEELRPGRPPTADASGPPPMLGDVILDPTQISRQASDRGVDFEDEISLMVVHGVLHLLGYDHSDESDAEAMEARERQLLAEAGRSR